MANSSGNVNNIVGLGGVDTSSNLTIPEANAQGYFSLSFGTGTAAGSFSPFFKNGVLYQVTNGKTCVVVHVIVTGPTAANSVQLVHSLTTFTFNAGSITSGAYQGGAAAQYVYSVVSTNVPTTQ